MCAWSERGGRGRRQAPPRARSASVAVSPRRAAPGPITAPHTYRVKSFHRFPETWTENKRAENLKAVVLDCFVATELSRFRCEF